MTYWAYCHNVDGDIIADFAEFDSVDSAKSRIGKHLGDCGRSDCCSHIVNMKREGTSVWIAGPRFTSCVPVINQPNRHPER